MSKKLSRPKLFNLNSKRNRALNECATMMRECYYFHREGGFARGFLSILKGEDRKKCIIECDETEKQYHESYRVLLSVLYHSKSWFREDDLWENEFEIPIEVFERGIQTALDKINFYKNGIAADLAGDRYIKMEELLKELLEYRRTAK